MLVVRDELEVSVAHSVRRRGSAESHLLVDIGHDRVFFVCGDDGPTSNEVCDDAGDNNEEGGDCYARVHVVSSLYVVSGAERWCAIQLW